MCINIILVRKSSNSGSFSAALAKQAKDILEHPNSSNKEIVAALKKSTLRQITGFFDDIHRFAPKTLPSVPLVEMSVLVLKSATQTDREKYLREFENTELVPCMLNELSGSSSCNLIDGNIYIQFLQMCAQNEKMANILKQFIQNHVKATSLSSPRTLLAALLLSVAPHLADPHLSIGPLLSKENCYLALKIAPRLINNSHTKQMQSRFIEMYLSERNN